MSGSRVLVALRIDAPPDRTFAAFVDEIGSWWHPNGLFRFTDRDDTHLAFEPDPPERLVEVGADGSRFEIGRIVLWQPPTHLAFGWRQSNFPEGRTTEVRVRFEADDDDGATTRVTVEHLGWDGIPQEQEARHGFPLEITQRRLAEWWRELLGSLAGPAVTDPTTRPRP